MTDTNSTEEADQPKRTMADSHSKPIESDDQPPPSMDALAQQSKNNNTNTTVSQGSTNLGNRESNPATTTAINPNNSETHHQMTAQQFSQPLKDAEQRLLKAKRDLESMVLKYAKSEQENLQNKIKVDELDKKLKRAIKDNDQLANRIKLLSNDKNQLTDSLSSKVAQLTVLEQKNTYLNGIQGVKLKEYEEKIKKLESSNAELLKQVDEYQSKQTELMDFSERLSMKHMLLQTELDEALKKVPFYQEQHEKSLRERDAAIQQREELSEQIDTLSESLLNEQKLNESLRKALDEAERRYQAATDEHLNEVKIMRRKHQMATRELVKEIKQLQGRLGEIEPLKQELQINA